jgi:hypothetical protein
MLVRYFSIPALVHLFLREVSAASLLRSVNVSSIAIERAGQQQGACDEGLRALKEKLRDDHGFPIPSDGHHTWEVEGGADSGLFSYLGKLSHDEMHLLGGTATDRTVCETGFNYGTSAYAFLCSTEAKVFSWDLGQHDYVEPASELINADYPGRHHLELGDSCKMLPQAISSADRGPLHARHCDIVYVDGGHSQEVASADIANFAQLARPGALLVVDDCHHSGHGHIQGVTTAFEQAVNAGKVLEERAMARKFTEGRSICVGRYPKSASRESFLARVR